MSVNVHSAKPVCSKVTVLLNGFENRQYLVLHVVILCCIKLVLIILIYLLFYQNYLLYLFIVTLI